MNCERIFSQNRFNKHTKSSYGGSTTRFAQVKQNKCNTGHIEEHRRVKTVSSSWLLKLKQIATSCSEEGSPTVDVKQSENIEAMESWIREMDFENVNSATLILNWLIKIGSDSTDDMAIDNDETIVIQKELNVSNKAQRLTTDKYTTKLVHGLLKTTRIVYKKKLKGFKRKLLSLKHYRTTDLLKTFN